MRFRLRLNAAIRSLVLLAFVGAASYCFLPQIGSYFSFGAYMCLVGLSFWIGIDLMYSHPNPGRRSALAARYDLIWNAVAILALLGTVTQAGIRLWHLEEANSENRRSILEYGVLRLEPQPLLAVNCPESSEAAKKAAGCAIARRLVESIERFRMAQRDAVSAPCASSTVERCPRPEVLEADSATLPACTIERCRIQNAREILLLDFHIWARDPQLGLPSQYRALIKQWDAEVAETGANWRILHPIEPWLFHFLAFGVALALGLRLAKAVQEWIERDKSCLAAQWLGERLLWLFATPEPFSRAPAADST